MFKKSKIKIVAAIMIVLILLFAGTLGVIYVSSYMDVYSQNQEMLERYCNAHSLGEKPDLDLLLSDDEKLPKADGLVKRIDRFIQLSTFYSVSLSETGEVLEIDDNNSSVYPGEKLTELALSLLEGKRTNGTADGLVYRISEMSGYTLVAFMDNTILSESITTLFRYTLIFGSITIVLLFFLSFYLAKRIVDPLEENYQQQKQFLSDAGHELKTPVAVIRANADLLSREIGENQWLSNIQYENNRMSVLIRQLMELVRTENVTPAMEWVNLSRIVIGEILPFESIAFEKGIELFYDGVASDVFVNGNGAQLGQIVTILLDNAIEYSCARGKICVSLVPKHNKVYLSVTNQGEEIPPEQQKHLFERFYRADFARNTEDNHYGLGLAIAKAIVTAHHGEISVSCKDGLVTFSVGLLTGHF